MLSTKNILIVVAVIAVVYLLMQGKVIDYAKRLTTAVNPFNVDMPVEPAGNPGGQQNNGALSVEPSTPSNIVINYGGGDSINDYALISEGGGMGGASLPVYEY